MPTADSIPCRGADVTASVSSGEAVLMLPALGQIKVLNEVGTRVWELIDGSRSIGEVVDTICGEYAVDQDRALADTLVFVEELVEKGLATIQQARLAPAEPMKSGDES